MLLCRSSRFEMGTKRVMRDVCVNSKNEKVN